MGLNRMLNPNLPEEPEDSESLEPNEAPFIIENDKKDIEEVANFYFKTLAALKNCSFGLGRDVCSKCHQVYLCHFNLRTLETRCIKCFAKEKTKIEFKNRQPIIKAKIVDEVLEIITKRG